VWLAAIGLSAAALWMFLVGLEDLLRARQLSGAVRSAEATMVGPALLAVVAVVLVIERWRPAVSRPWRARAHVVDAGYLGLYALVGPVVTVLNVGFALEVERHARFLLLDRIGLVSRLVVVALILLAIDAMNWAAHVANHRSSTLWRFHALHHSQEDMSVLTTFRTHPLAHVSYLPALLPVLVLSASGSVPELGLIVYGCLVTLPHANLRWRYGWLGRVVVSPAYHRLHHANTAVDGRPAVNFGFVLTVWDRLAGTAVYPDARVVPQTGIAGRPVPLEQQATGGAAVWRVVAAQLAQPFRLRSGLED
jgi:sterol desaturase/sphingolipid hydroxylase (fatty acid hydroxylase superfamily)